MMYAQKDVVAVLCLGADAILSLFPKSGFPAQNHFGIVYTTTQTKKFSDRSTDDLKVTMVHGDLLIFIGDDFEVPNIVFSQATTDLNFIRLKYNARERQFVRAHLFC
jgi:hypothetical protein